MNERCAIHPDRAAEVTCTRCGNFACYECVGPQAGGLCARCRLRMGGSRVGPVRTLAILTLVNGVLLSLFGGLYVILAPVFALMPPASSSRAGDPPPELFGVIFGCYGAAALMPGILQVIAGIRLLRGLRGRTFAMVALGAGFVGFLTCYCAPTSIALAVWGLMLLSDAEVRAAFEAQDRPQL